MLFGVTVAGRPVGMPEMQRTVGLFINSIPLRVQMPAAGQRCTVREWLNWLFERNLELRERALPLVAIQESSELPKASRCSTACSCSRTPRWKSRCWTARRA